MKYTLTLLLSLCLFALCFSQNSNIILEDSQGLDVVKLSAEGSATGSSYVYLKNTDDFLTASLFSEASSSNKSGRLILRQPDGARGLILDGASGTAGGSIILFDDSGLNSEVVINGTTGSTFHHKVTIFGSDFAERFDLSEASSVSQPGMVVSIDREHPGELRVSDEPYDQLVAGVISGAGGVNTGMLMGQEGTKADGDTPVAIAGRVYAFVDASKTPINVGDLLTTSKTPGHLMKVKKRKKAIGAIVGKALESLSDGTGLILILLNGQ